MNNLLLFQIKVRNTILPGKFYESDARRIADEMSKSEKNGWIYFVIEANND